MENLILFCIGVTMGILLGNALCSNEYTQPVAIEHGCGEYNSTTGEFQWIDRSVK